MRYERRGKRGWDGIQLRVRDCPVEASGGPRKG